MKKYYVKPALLNNEVEAECLLLVPSVNNQPADNQKPVLSKEQGAAEEVEYGDLW